ncbi:MAG: hypothetical protein IJQ75_07725 [Synergistaceae bacterium]|nr:hypothetical protein [Synergistaceae bacterium]MBQ3585256.1 hypothetical protein [Synergistaceae bacterium]MBR0279848.1 hypothetical protein [Synergistaceae bacterium]
MEIGLMTLAGTFAGGLVIGAAADRLAVRRKENAMERRKRLLYACFGYPMFAGTFTLSEARDWINARNEQLEQGSKAVICKATNDNFKILHQELNIDLDKETYLIVAIVNDEDKDNIRDSLLVRYEKLDSKMENALAKGNGVLVVEA